MWELSNDALFYALSRPKLQPFWTSDEEEFTFVDPCHGMYMYMCMFTCTTYAKKHKIASLLHIFAISSCSYSNCIDMTFIMH